MSKELVISTNRHETKVAILEDDQLVEVYFQRANEYSLAGSIHKGRVTRVLPGMQSAFVDLGLERDTFLYVSDFFEENEEYDRIGEKDARPERSPRPAPEVRVERPTEAPASVARPEDAPGETGEPVAAAPAPAGAAIVVVASRIQNTPPSRATPPKSGRLPPPLNRLRLSDPRAQPANS